MPYKKPYRNKEFKVAKFLQEKERACKTQERFASFLLAKQAKLKLREAGNMYFQWPCSSCGGWHLSLVKEEWLK